MIKIFAQVMRGKSFFQKLSIIAAVSFLLLSFPYLWKHIRSVQATHTTITTPFDTVPDFCDQPSVTSVGSGNWSNPTTWSAGRVPAGNDKVHIAPSHSITYDAASDAALDCVKISGKLDFKTDANTRIKAGTIMVMEGGQLIAGTETKPVSVNVLTEIIIANKPLDLVADEEQMGTGLLVWGKITMHGATKDSTFVRLATEPKKNDTTLTLEKPVTGWRVGDRLILPDTRQIKWNEKTNWAKQVNMQWEELILQNISSDKKTITLSQPLQFDHLGARDGNGKLDFLPHVGNLDRNVIVRSELPISGGGTQGHTYFTYRADVDIQYAAFRDLGRTTVDPINETTNHYGREPVHFAHLMGPTTTPTNGYQYTFIGNAVDGGSSIHKRWWGIHIQDSHYGLIKDNVVYNYGGFLVGTSGGNESFNVIDHNFAVRSFGTAGRLGMGREGVGFYLRGTNNYVKNNVASDITTDGADSAYGYKYQLTYLGKVKIPKFKGADTSKTTEYNSMDGNTIPVLEFDANEVYGATESGLTYWWIGFGVAGNSIATGDSVFKNFHVWHVFNKGIFNYPSDRVLVDGMIVRGKDPDLSACCVTGIFLPDYLTNDVTIRNTDIQGMKTAIVPTTNTGGGIQIIEDSYLRSVTNIVLNTMWTSAGASGGLQPRKVIIRNVKFDAWPSKPLQSISMAYSNVPVRTIVEKDQTLVYDYNGIPGNNFQVFYKEQSADFVLPQTITEYVEAYKKSYTRLEACPEGGLTNQQCWDKYGIAVAGEIAPCTDTTTHPEIKGFTCPITTPPPPSPPSLRITQPISGATITSNEIDIAYKKSGDLTQAHHARWKLDNNPEIEDTLFAGTYKFTNLTTGNHTISGYLVRADKTKISGTDDSISFTVANQDKTPPVLSNGKPSGTLPANTDEVTLSLETNEAALCKFSTTPNTNYELMSDNFFTTGETNHSHPITGLSKGCVFPCAEESFLNAGGDMVKGRNYTYYVKCADSIGNASKDDYPISFFLSDYQKTDLNKDGKTDQLDYGILKQNWNQTGKPVSDINQDGIVDARDLGMLMGEWNKR